MIVRQCHVVTTTYCVINDNKVGIMATLGFQCRHYNRVIMGTIASQITSFTIVYSIVYSDLFRCRSKKTSKLRLTGLCAGNSPGPVNSLHKWPVTWKMFPFDVIIMKVPWLLESSVVPSMVCVHEIVSYCSQECLVCHCAMMFGWARWAA